MDYRLKNRVEIGDLVSRIGRLIDTRQFDELMEHYAEDIELGRYGQEPTRGRAAVREAYKKLEQTADQRVVRHQFSDLVIHENKPGRVSSTCLVLMYMGHGELPVSTGAPVLIQDFHDEFVLQDDAWLLRRRTIHRIFASDDFRDSLELGGEEHK